MQKSFTISRLGGTAIAAVLALSATPAFAQEVTPQEVPQATAPATTPTPTLTTPVASDPVVAPTPDPLAAEPAVDSTPEPAPVAKTTSKPAKPVTAKPAARSTAPTHSTAPVAATPTSAPASAAPAPLPEALPTEPLAAAPAPISEPVQPPVASAPADETLPIALGAGLGILALGGAAFALRRRRRDRVEDEVIVREPTIARQPVEPMTATPAIAERSAFSWGTPAAATAASSPARGRTWVERAHDGPTPENPFLSLKKRLQRAAFYDQRERAVAAGSAKPLSPMAGLPARFAQALKPKAATPSYGFSYA